MTRQSYLINVLQGRENDFFYLLIMNGLIFWFLEFIKTYLKKGLLIRHKKRYKGE